MYGEPRSYLSYLLRLWQTRQDGTLVWRASLQSPDTGERQGFASLEALLVFLRQEFHDPQSQVSSRGRSQDSTQTGVDPDGQCATEEEE